jgi:hypothetical protein
MFKCPKSDSKGFNLNIGIIIPNHINKALEVLKISPNICEYKLELILKPFKAVQEDSTSPFIQLSYNHYFRPSRKLLRDWYYFRDQAAYTKQSRTGVLRMGVNPCRSERLNSLHLQPLHLVQPLCRVGDFRLEKGGKAERGRGIMLISSPYNSTSNCISKRFVSPLYNVGLYRVCVGLGVFLMCLLEQACYHRIVSKGFLERYAYVYLCITGLYSKVYRSDSNKSFVLGVLWLLEHIRTSCEGLIKIFDIV